MKNSWKVTIACIIMTVSIISFIVGSTFNPQAASASLESANVFGSASAATAALMAWVENHDLGHDPATAGKQAREFYQAFMGH